MKKLPIYLDLCTQYYDLDKPDAPADAINFYLSYAQRVPGYKVLEPMCGSGRFFIPFLEAGYDICGFDASIYMLNSLRQRCEQLQLEPVVWQNFLQDFDQSQEYNLIFIPDGSWNLILDAQAIKHCLHVIYKHLAPGGKFVFEVITTKLQPPALNVWCKMVQKRSDNALIYLNTLSTYNASSQLYKTICRYELVENNAVTKIEIEHFDLFLYQPFQMDQLLQEVGFTAIKRMKNTLGYPATEDDELIFYECIK